MKIIFIGDIVGRSGREAILKNLPILKEKFKPEVIIANAENASSGYGLTKKIANELFELGIQVLTLGNHAWDQREMLSYIEECPKIIRANNYPTTVPGKGFVDITLEDGRKLILMQVMLRLFMGLSLDDPFASITNRLSSEFLGSTNNSILIDLQPIDKNHF